MILDPLLLMLFLLIAAFGFAVLVFSPFIIELKKPRDKGPRKIPKTPLEKEIRSIGRKPVNIGLSPAECSDHARNLQHILSKAGVKTIRIGKDTIRVFGDITFAPRFEVADNLVVEGALRVGDNCVLHRSVKAKGNAFIGNHVVIKGNLVSEGDVTILDDVVVGGSVHSEGSVTIGENVFVALSVVAAGNVELFENSEVKRNILTRGVIKVLRHPRVDLPSSIDDIG